MNAWSDLSSRSKRIIVSAVFGLVLSGLGLLLVSVGGWGPCGPASNTARLGGWLSIDHVILWCTWIPGIEDWLRRVGWGPLYLAFLILIPAWDWGFAAFVLLTLSGLLRPSRRRST